MLPPPTPVTLVCALILCLPLAIVFTITTPNAGTTSTTSAAASATTTTIVTAPVTTANKIIANPLPTSAPILKTQQKPHNKTTIYLPPPLPYSPKDDDESLFQLAARVNPKPTRLGAPKKLAFPPKDDDESLFQLAARVNPKPTLGAPKKLAFMFLTTTPLPFAPLWELFFHHAPKRLYNIYIHADPSFQYDPRFQGVFSNRLIPSKPTRRHSPTLIAAARRLLSRALLQDPSNSMFALLSPACIPLHSFNFTYKTLIKSRKSFIEILKNEVGAYDRWAARGEEVMLPEVTFVDFRIGSQFFVLTRRHARIVVRDRRLWSKFMLPCLNRHTCYPEEHFFATLLSMVDPHGCVPATLTHVDWRGGHDGHPRTYFASEVDPDLIRTLRKGRPRYGDDGTNGSNSSVSKRRDPFLFARKFSPDSVQPLMSIADEVIFKD